MRYSIITTGLLLAASTASALRIPRQEPAGPSPAGGDVAATKSTTSTTTTADPSPTILPDQGGNAPGNVQNPAVGEEDGNKNPPPEGQAGSQNPAAGGGDEGDKNPPVEGQTDGQKPGATPTTADSPSIPVETDKPTTTDNPDHDRTGTFDPSGTYPVDGQPGDNNPDKTNPEETNPDKTNPDKSSPSNSNPNQSNPDKSNPGHSTKPFTPAGWYEYLSLANIVLRVAREGGPSYLYALKTITDAALELFEEQGGNGGDNGHGKGGSGQGQGQGHGQGQGQGQWNHSWGHGPVVNTKREPGDYAGSDDINALELATDSYNTYWRISQGTS